MGVENKIILVTGASQGIGKACALKLARNGAKVVIAARSKEKLDAVAAEADGDVLAVACDASDAASVDALYKAIADKHGRLDVLFNNAGNNHPSTDFGDLAFEDWRKVIGLNLDGAFLMANGAYRMMRDQSPRGGRIINNGSISAHAPRPGSAPYTASKHGISGLTKTISLDGRKHDIACCQIDIGNAMTDMAARMAERRSPGRRLDQARAADGRRRRRRHHPLHGRPRPFGQRADRHHHGDQDAVRRPGLTVRVILL